MRLTGQIGRDAVRPTKQTLEILRHARQMIADPQKWTTGSMAYDIYKNPVAPNSCAATCWCATGAVIASTLRITSGQEEYQAAIDNLAIELQPFFYSSSFGAITFFNDTHSHSHIIDLFDRAISAIDLYISADLYLGE